MKPSKLAPQSEISRNPDATSKRSQKRGGLTSTSGLTSGRPEAIRQRRNAITQERKEKTYWRPWIGPPSPSPCSQSSLQPFVPPSSCATTPMPNAAVVMQNCNPYQRSNWCSNSIPVSFYAENPPNTAAEDTRLLHSPVQSAFQPVSGSMKGFNIPLLSSNVGDIGITVTTSNSFPVAASYSMQAYPGQTTSTCVPNDSPIMLPGRSLVCPELDLTTGIPLTPLILWIDAQQNPHYISIPLWYLNFYMQNQ